MKQCLSQNDLENNELAVKHKDRWVPWCFVAFFVVIAILDGIFVYAAISTNTGLVTEQAYEKGLKYNQILETARDQNNMPIQYKISYESGVLKWTLQDVKGNPAMSISNVQAHIMRPIQDGYDFDVAFTAVGAGVYQAIVKPPLLGAWTAKLSADVEAGADKKQRFQTTYRFNVQSVDQ